MQIVLQKDGQGQGGRVGNGDGFNAVAKTVKRYGTPVTLLCASK